MGVFGGPSLSYKGVKWANSDKTTFVTENKPCQKKLHSVLKRQPIWLANLFILERSVHNEGSVNLFDTDFWSKKNWNEGQLRRAVTRHEIIKNYMSHTYSESPGRALSHGATQFMSYICKKMSKSRFRDPSEQGFLRFSELGSPDYIVKTTIFSVWVFLMVSVHGNTLYAIAIHKNRSITPF